MDWDFKKCFMDDTDFIVLGSIEGAAVRLALTGSERASKWHEWGTDPGLGYQLLTHVCERLEKEKRTPSDGSDITVHTGGLTIQLPGQTPIKIPRVDRSSS